MPIPLSAAVMAVTAALAIALTSVPRAAEPGAGLVVSDVSKWPLEKVTRMDGKTFAGLIRHEDPRQIELVEVVRRPGKPMFLLVRPLNVAEVTKVERLSPAQREVLKQRIAAFRNRTSILAALAADVRLVKRTKSKTPLLHYDGPWFALDSTANERITREAIVRIEQTFAGYRTLLRPRRDPPRPLGILLFGSVGEYQQYLAAADLEIRNPAFFDPYQNLIVAGGDLATLAAKLDEVRAYHEQRLKQQREQDEQFQQRLRDLAAALNQEGASPDKRGQVLSAARHQWRQQREALERDIRGDERYNSVLYYHCFSRLYHEAFHAYLDNYVYDKQHYDVPRWINEGWAQIFEAGQFDGSTLRLDAPRPDFLDWLANDLRGDTPLSLSEVLSAPPEKYLVVHQDTAHHASRLYRYCWGLAYDLTFRGQLLETPAMEQYLRHSDSPRDPIRRFEKLVGKPLPVFEEEWRRSMLSLQASQKHEDQPPTNRPAATPGDAEKAAP